MTLHESSSGLVIAAGWKIYSVRRSDKEPLLRFVRNALEMRDCRVLYASEPNQAPFYIVFETAAGERHGVLVYAFFANSKATRHRPDDEHRFQIKYSSELRGILDVWIDPHLLITTLFIGIDPARNIFVAADPLMNNPSPMSRSVEFKAQNVDDILTHGWSTWERDRKPAKTRSRPTPILDDDTRIQVLIGGTQDRLLDLIRLERVAAGLDPGERQLLAEKLKARPGESNAAVSHKILEELGLPAGALFDLIDSASRLKMAVRGWVAETHLVRYLEKIPGVSDCRRLEGDGQPDVYLRWREGPPLTIECKNVLRKTTAANVPRVDFQRTRSSKEDPCSRYYRPTDFAILAACLHAVTEEWEYRFAATTMLPPHQTCPGRITNNIHVQEPLFTDDPKLVFSLCST
jgi:hypothetical protein